MRGRPHMWIGEMGTSGLECLVLTVLLYSFDDDATFGGRATSAVVTIRRDGGIVVADNGVGLPVDAHPTVRDLFTTAYVGRGPKAMGLVVVTGFSSRVVVTVKRDGRVWCQEFADDDATGDPRDIGETTETGTTVEFWPNPALFPDPLDAHSLLGRLQDFTREHANAFLVVVDETAEWTRRQRVFGGDAEPIWDSITPYRELKQGDESIRDHLDGGDVPDKVIEYLKSGTADVVCLGVYDHPFTGKRLLGPYAICDDTRYCWDRDTWKYVKKYRLSLPSEFIDFVMSPAGDEALKTMKQGAQWPDVIADWKQQPNRMVMMPADGGDVSLDDF